MKIMTKYELCSVLLKWLQTFNLTGPHKTIDDICDGVAIAQALNQIAPEWFNEIWLSKIKIDVGENWRLKISNLKKLIQAITDYYQEYFNQPLAELGKPDVVKIAEQADTVELVKLLRLVLGCAVNCNKKQDYIKSIMLLEESVQNVIMQSIQELEHLLGPAPLSFNTSLNMDSDSQIQQLMSELQLVRESRDEVTQKCLELDMQVNILQEEKNHISDEKRILGEQIQELMEDPIKDNILRKQIETLKEEIFKLESSKDDYRLKLELQEKEMVELQLKFDVLQQTAVEARNLKDEVDILRENADKVEKLELSIQSYKKKLEEMSELKREMKLLENKNLSYIQQVMELEEEVKKANTWKSQIEVYKKQIAELRSNLNEETKKVDKIEFENMQIQQKLNALHKEKERIVVERDSLKEANEELMCIKLQMKGNDAELTVSEHKVGIINEGIMSKMELKRELVRLQHENNLLKLNQKDEKLPVLQLIVDDFTQQNKELQGECRQANQRILELEAELKELNEKTGADASMKIKELENQLEFERNQRLSDIAEKERIILEQKQLSLIMQDTIIEKEQEIQDIDEKYKKLVEKAKSVAKSFDSSQILTSDISPLRNKLPEKESIVEDNIEKQYERNQLIKESEDKIISSPLYNIASKRRESMDQTLVNANSVGGNLTFLSKQRQSATRRVSYNSK